MTATVTANNYLKYPCGGCKAGLHHLCPAATWNPGSGPILVPATGSIPAVHAGEALWCPCADEVCQGRTPRCRDCGYQWGSLDGLGPRLVCEDRAACELRIGERLQDDPLHQLIEQCRTLRITSEGLVERPRRATPQERVKAKSVRVAQMARPCTCGCGGTTKGGAFLPGHDARFVSALAQGDLAVGREALAPFPALLAKFEKRKGLA